jgi:GNAT superfamily N-acetyltransferase
VLKRVEPEDSEQLGDICYRAFRSIADRHNFPPDFPSSEVASSLIRAFAQHPAIFGLAAEIDGKLAGSNFLDERDTVSGVGPITVDPLIQDRGTGRLLMEAILARAREQRAPGVRLVQAAYHTRSLSLYTKLGFQVRESLACLQGPPIRVRVPGRTVRQARVDDLPACDALCERVHGHTRHREVEDALGAGTARVVECDGRVVAYASALAYFGHGVSESNLDVEALIGSGEPILGPGLLVPAKNRELFC